MMKRDNKTYRNWLCLLWLAVFTSCMDETFTASDVEGTFISIRGMAPHTGSVHSGTPEDYIIHTLRVLAFDKTTGDKVTNLFYNAHSGDIIRHPINAGSYDFVFLANEPAYQPVRTLLDAITHYGDLNHIAYPADFFSSEQIIPMMQEIKNVTVLSGGQGATLEDNTTVSILQLALERMGVRVDVILRAEDDLDQAFKGIMFSNLPNLVPLTATYDGPAIERSVIRTFTVVDDGSYFTQGTPTAEWDWEKKVNRIILTRPAVEAGERLGFLPGDLQSKVDPYLRPLYDALFDMLGAETYQKYLERGNIEVAPLAYMRGRTLDDSFIILDEAQNTTREQMKMFLTRLGFGSKIVITGDVTQIDLPGDKVSGLKEAIRVLEGVEDIQICKLTASDVVRHVLVQRIVAAYDAYEKTRPPEQPRNFIKRNSK